MGRAVSAACVILCGIIAAIVTVIGNAAQIQRRATFRPQSLTFRELAALPLSLVCIRAADGPALWCGYVPAPRPDTPPLLAIFFHGRGGNITSNWAHVARGCAAGYATLLVEYRGFGLSEGMPTEKGLYADADAALAWAAGVLLVPRHRILLHGYSLGCAMALHLAAAHEDDGAGAFRGLLLEAPFATLKTAAIHTLSSLTAPLRPLIAPLFDNVARARRVVRTPLAIVHGVHDEVTPYADSATLIAVTRSLRRRLFVSAAQKHRGPHADARCYAWLDAPSRPRRHSLA